MAGENAPEEPALQLLALPGEAGIRMASLLFLWQLVALPGLLLKGSLGETISLNKVLGNIFVRVYLKHTHT